MQRKSRKGIASLPGALNEAIYLMKKNDLVKRALGEHIYNEFVSSKEKSGMITEPKFQDGKLKTICSRF